VIWPLPQLKPDFKTIADFRRDNRRAFHHPSARRWLGAQAGVGMVTPRRAALGVSSPPTAQRCRHSQAIGLAPLLRHLFRKKWLISLKW
jgi:hypothetical protein